MQEAKRRYRMLVVVDIASDEEVVDLEARKEEVLNTFVSGFAGAVEGLFNKGNKIYIYNIEAVFGEVPEDVSEPAADV